MSTLVLHYGQVDSTSSIIYSFVGFPFENYFGSARDCLEGLVSYKLPFALLDTFLCH